MYPEGIYKGKIIAWGLSETTNRYPQFWVSFDNLGLADPNDPTAQPKPCEPGTRTWSITITSDQNAEWLISNIQALGYDRDDLLGLDPEQAKAYDFSGK